MPTQPITGSQVNDTHEGILYIDKQKIRKVSRVQYGFHYEEIGMIGEGALHAELVHNRSLEEATPPADLAVKNGLYQNIPNLRGENRDVFHADPLIGWNTYPLSYTPIFISCTEEGPLNKKNRYSILISMTEDIADNPEVTILNRGYYGMNLRKKAPYRLSMYIKNRNYTALLQVMLVDEQGKSVSTQSVLDVKGKEWTKLTGTLKPDKDARRGMPATQLLDKGQLQLDVVSLFLSDTQDNGKSAFRASIMQNLKEYAPGFIHFPDGCIVHGVNEATMYHWRKTVGPIENRPG